MNKDIMICGVGGQGTVLASKIIAASAMDEGNAVHSAETIGMAQRGGPVTSHVRIGEDAFSPLIPVGGADLLIAFEPSEAVRNLKYLTPFGSSKFFNVAVLGAAAGTGELGISAETIRGEIVSIVPERFQEKNLAAFAAGYKIGEENYADQ